MAFTCASTVKVMVMSAPFTVPVTSDSPKVPAYCPVSFSPSCLNVNVGAPAPAAVSTLNAHLPVTSTLAWAATRATDRTPASTTIAPTTASRSSFFVIGFSFAAPVRTRLLFHVGISVLPVRRDQRPFGTRCGGVAGVFSDERERQVRASVFRIVFQQLPRRPRRQVPFADLARGAGDCFDREQRLRPGIRSRPRAQFANDRLEHRTPLGRLLGPQEELALECLQRIGDDSRSLRPPHQPQRLVSFVRRFLELTKREPCISSLDVPRGADDRRRVRGHHPGGEERLLGTSAREQKYRPLALVELLHRQRRWDRERPSEQLLGF